MFTLKYIVLRDSFIDRYFTHLRMQSIYVGVGTFKTIPSCVYSRNIQKTVTSSVQNIVRLRVHEKHQIKT
jgi:hypothetical protein